VGSPPARLGRDLNLPRPHGALFLGLGVTIANQTYLSCLGTDALGSRDMHEGIFFDVLDIQRHSDRAEGFLIEVAFATQDG